MFRKLCRFWIYLTGCSLKDEWQPYFFDHHEFDKTQLVIGHEQKMSCIVMSYDDKSAYTQWRFVFLVHVSELIIFWYLRCFSALRHRIQGLQSNTTRSIFKAYSYYFLGWLPKVGKRLQYGCANNRVKLPHENFTLVITANGLKNELVQ